MLDELRDQSAPGGVGEGGESAVERGVVILNHVVKYRDGGLHCQPGRAIRAHEAAVPACRSEMPLGKDVKITKKTKEE